VKILILEPFLAGSHAAWAQEYARRSGHEVKILSLQGRYWKWRMHGGAVTLARLFEEGAYIPDLLLATDMLDLSTFLALTRHRTANLKTILYFHENQICYPWSEGDTDPARERDAHYGFINLTSALAADAVAFNSEYHRNIFLDALAPFLRSFPDYHETDAVPNIKAKSRVLYLGLDLIRFDGYKQERKAGEPALILWNHRWEYDKNPEDFFRALLELKEEGLEFEVAVLGESYAEKPPIFEEASLRLKDRIVHAGYVGDFAAYATWLWKADIIPVTSIQDFFGASVVQAIYCNCFPLLPRRLAYEEHVPPREGRFFYADFGDLVARLRLRISNIEETRKVSTQRYVSRYDWSLMAPRYDTVFDTIVEAASPNKPKP
jgi:glycosyltransferase involved in cell wall biosynthesis